MKGDKRPNGTSLHRPVGRTLNEKGDAKTIQSRVSNPMYRALNKHAGEFNVTLSTVIRVCIKIALHRPELLREMLQEEAF